MHEIHYQHIYVREVYQVRVNLGSARPAAEPAKVAPPA